MKNNISKLPGYISVLLIVSLTLVSCKKFVEIDPPKQHLVSESVFKTNETAIAAMLNIYSLMGSSIGAASPYNMTLYTGLAADELTSFSTTITIQQLYTNNLIAAASSSNNIWNTGYNFIYRANAVIEGCEASTSLGALVKQQLIGEAKFVRAFWHFYLVNSFGDIPIILSTNYTANAKLPRTEKTNVYQQIIQDLKDAQSVLQENYVGLDAVTVSPERARPNKAAATFLLARVYLYTENFANAEEQASKVIDQNTVYGIASLDSAFLKNNKESVWQLMVTTPNLINTAEGAGFILTTKPSTQISNSSAISPSLLGAFETNDKRSVNWVAKFTDASVVPNVNYYYPFKYKVKAGVPITEYSTVFRLAELYLIRAESRAKSGKLASGIDDIDAVRKRAGLPLIKSTNPAISKDDLLTTILKERRVELFTEWGHRWYDLKRTGKINEVMINAATAKGSTWSSDKQLWPIPALDIQNNPFLVQNPGYN